ncbi:hypothetical protein ACLMJK_005518 [Lecanora helva]
MASNDSFQSCLISNKHWAQTTTTSDPQLLPTLSQGQSPQILWLGCSDSRVPETTILGLKPGDVFTHRNIANILPANDLNSLSVIAYAVEHLHVKHVVVCGHTSCGGCAAALGNDKLGVIDTWIAPLRKLRAQHAQEWDRRGLGEKEKALALVEANVRAGVQTLRENPDVIEGMQSAGLQVHGCVYDLGKGEVRELDCREDEGGAKSRMEAFMMKLKH